MKSPVLRAYCGWRDVYFLINSFCLCLALNMFIQGFSMPWRWIAPAQSGSPAAPSGRFQKYSLCTCYSSCCRAIGGLITLAKCSSLLCHTCVIVCYCSVWHCKYFPPTIHCVVTSKIYYIRVYTSKCVGYIFIQVIIPKDMLKRAWIIKMWENRHISANGI